jgi:endoglucanase
MRSLKTVAGRIGLGGIMTTILQELCSLPTAPFLEGRVVEYIRQFVAERKKLRLTHDEHGNLLITLPGKSKAVARWVFTAHMDHPGLISGRMLDEQTVECELRGWVLAELMKGAKVRFFAGEKEIRGEIIDVSTDDRDGRGERGKLARVRVGKEVPANVPGMFDQGRGRIRNGKFYSRVCDDLAGAAAALRMLHELHENPPQSTVAVLLTRAEEEGFIGAVAASIEPRLLKKSDRLVAIECSAAQPHAPIGGGAIIRVGDRTSIFNSSLTFFLTQQAETLAKDDSSFRYQRQLMPGGTCEATVYDIYGFHASSMCVALGNYHNMDRKRGKIAAEYIDVEDWRNMVKLFLAVARAGHTYTGENAALRMRIEKRFESLRHLLNERSDN